MQINENLVTYTAPTALTSDINTDTFSLIVSDGSDESDPAEFSVSPISASDLIRNGVFVQSRLPENIYFIDALQNVPQNLGDTFTLDASISPFGATQVEQGGSVRVAPSDSNVNVVPVNFVVQSAQGEYLSGQVTLVLED